MAQRRRSDVAWSAVVAAPWRAVVPAQARRCRRKRTPRPTPGTSFSVVDQGPADSSLGHVRRRRRRLRNDFGVAGRLLILAASSTAIMFAVSGVNVHLGARFTATALLRSSPRPMSPCCRSAFPASPGDLPRSRLDVTRPPTKSAGLRRGESRHVVPLLLLVAARCSSAACATVRNRRGPDHACR